MKIIQILRAWRKQTQDPVKHCMIHRAVGCAHVDGMLCNMKTCDIVVRIDLTPNTAKEMDRHGRYEVAAIEAAHNIKENT